MRIEDEINITGQFWLPSNPETKVHGNLIITDGGDIELHTIGYFDKSEKGTEAYENHALEVKTIHGSTENISIVLEDCFISKQNSFYNEDPKSTIIANYAFLNLPPKKTTPIKLKSIRFTIEGIIGWMNLTGFQKTETKKQAITVQYNEPEKISLETGKDFKFHIITTAEYEITFQKALINNTNYLEIEYTQEEELEKFINEIYKITHLVGFSLNETVSIKDVHSIEDTVKTKIYYNSLPFNKKNPNISPLKTLFTFNKKKHKSLIKNWLKLYDEIDSVMHLYFSFTTGAQRHLEHKFLVLSQALESYHQKKHDITILNRNEFKQLREHLISTIEEHCPKDHVDLFKNKIGSLNGVTLRHRLQDLLERSKLLKDREHKIEDIAKSISDTRNYLTHHDPKGKKNALSGYALYEMNYKIDFLLKFFILTELGFSEDEIDSIFYRVRSLRDIKNNFLEEIPKDEE